MCGRYALALLGPAVAEAMAATPRSPDVMAWRERFNIAPTQLAPIVVQHDATSGGGRGMVLARWGLVPHWSRDAAIGVRLLNARADSVADKPAFRDAWRRRRCLVPATAFYEWQAASDEPPASAKQPFAIAAAADGLLAFGGLWERWSDPKGGATPLESFTIITTDANAFMRPMHDRMPLIVPPAAWDRWLDTTRLPTELLNPSDASERAGPDLRAWRITSHVNATRHDDPACLAPA